jgi:hypothetical protein
LEENERALSAAPTRSAQMPDLTQVPNLKIKNGDEITGGDFMRSSTLTTVCLQLACADICRRISRRLRLWGRRSNLFGVRLISLCQNSLVLVERMN